MIEDHFIDRRRAFADFLNTNTDKEIRHESLKKRIIDYIMERARRKNIYKLPKKLLSVIETSVEEIVDDTIESSLDEFKRVEIDEVIAKEQSFHFDRYEIPETSDEILIVRNIPEKHIHFDRYETKVRNHIGENEEE